MRTIECRPSHMAGQPPTSITLFRPEQGNSAFLVGPLADVQSIPQEPFSRNTLALMSLLHCFSEAEDGVVTGKAVVDALLRDPGRRGYRELLRAADRVNAVVGSDMIVTNDPKGSTARTFSLTGVLVTHIVEGSPDAITGESTLYRELHDPEQPSSQQIIVAPDRLVIAGVEGEKRFRKSGGTGQASASWRIAHTVTSLVASGKRFTASDIISAVAETYGADDMPSRAIALDMIHRAVDTINDLAGNDVIRADGSDVDGRVVYAVSHDCVVHDTSHRRPSAVPLGYIHYALLNTTQGAIVGIEPLATSLAEGNTDRDKTCLIENLLKRLVRSGYYRKKPDGDFEKL